MEVSTQPEPRVRRGLLVMGLATAALVCAVMTIPRLAHLVLARSSDSDNFDVSFNGWQVDVAEGLIGLLIALTVVVSALLVKRRWSALRGRTPYLRVPILIALLPAIGLGDMARTPVTAAVRWTSDHTAAAAQAKGEFEREIAEHRRSPTIRTSSEPAPAGLARLLLSPADLGASWYDAFSPNPAARLPVPGEKTNDAARSTLVRTHREGEGWALAAPLLQERVTVLATAAAASSATGVYVPPGMNERTREVSGVPVKQLVTPGTNQNESASFAIGRFRFTVFSDGMPGNSFDYLVDAAVRKALHPR